MLEGQGKVEEARPIWQRLLQFEVAFAGEPDAARCVTCDCDCDYSVTRVQLSS